MAETQIDPATVRAIGNALNDAFNTLHGEFYMAEIGLVVLAWLRNLIWDTYHEDDPAFERELCDYLAQVSVECFMKDEP